ncbi:MAG: DUF2867 domain-containing protein [Natronospirillum sp.]|uniref:DUF2867 domain-containing protein n=1 Tax=Natronospirillum sp. TaxID=2812955 RepID=UPI0025F296E0|nr:DUF2867 domain-containing protein [Natronospirillum sp.]MCH8552576.1 DUF2867 domain-containing protein [Natronospirillum sp.]
MPEKATVPVGSRIQALVPDSYFHDAWKVRVSEPNLSALDHFLKAAQATPRWVSACMTLRNKVVGFFGLKNLGNLHHVVPDKKAADYKAGDRVGIFTLFENTFDEVLLGDKDKHLDVTLSVHRSVADSVEFVTITTVVKVHNALGRLYMVPVTPMHRIIVPAVLRAIANEASR